MKYILIYSYTDIYEKAECEFYTTKYEIPKREVFIFETEELLNVKLTELFRKLLKNFTYSIYEGKQIA
jgi:hypothetical protein